MKAKVKLDSLDKVACDLVAQNKLLNGVCVRGTQGSILLPKWVKSRTFKHHVRLVSNSHIITTRCTPAHVHTLATCCPSAKRPTIKSELQKALHTSTRNRWLTNLPMLATRLKPIMVCACNNPSNAGRSHKCPPNAYAGLKAFTVVPMSITETTLLS